MGGLDIAQPMTSPWTSSLQEQKAGCPHDRRAMSQALGYSPQQSDVGVEKDLLANKTPPTGPPCPEQETVHGPPSWSGQQNHGPPGLAGPRSRQQSTDLQAGAGRSSSSGAHGPVLLPEVPQSFSIINGSGMNCPNDLYLTKIKHVNIQTSTLTECR